MSELIPQLSVNIAIYIALLGAIILYFGKLIGDTKVEKYDKLEYYIEGLFFFAIYIFIPSLFAYYFRDFFKIQTTRLFFIQVTVFAFLSWNLIVQEYFIRHGLLNEFRKRAEQKLIEIKEQNSHLSELAEKRYGKDWFESNDILKQAEALFYKIPIRIFGNKVILFIFSFLTILSNIQLYELNDLFTFGISLLFAFFILTMVALAYGFSNANYPPAKIYTDEGTTLEGKVLKFGDYIYLIKDDKKFFVNKDKIIYIEESLFKEKSN